MQKFATRLLYHPLTLDVLVVYYHSSDSKAFKDFNIHQSIVSYEIGGKSDDKVDNLDNFILSNFVPIPIPILNKKRVIADAFVRL